MSRVAAAGRRVRSPVVLFAVGGIAALALVGALAAKLLERAATSSALRDARDVTQLAGQQIVAPALTQGLLAGDPSARARLDAVVRRRVLRSPVVRVKLWTPDGRIVYSDEPRLIGRRFPLEADDRAILRHGGVAAAVSRLGKPENRFEPRGRRLREVYVRIASPGGGPLLYEEYLQESSIAAAGRRRWAELLPVLIGALVVLELLQLPLAVSLARRLRRGQRERETLLRRAVTASELDRRRIARDLHDGVVQDLAGVSYSVSSAGSDVRRDPGRAESTLERTGSQVRHAMRQLRTLLVDLHPENLHRLGLEPALADLLARLHARSIVTELSIDPTVRLDRGSEALVFRTAQEALRGVTAEPGAARVAVHLTRADGHAVLRVLDDRHGAPACDERPRLGLRALDDLVRAAGGELTVRSRPGAGTALELRLPA